MLRQSKSETWREAKHQTQGLVPITTGGRKEQHRIINSASSPDYKAVVVTIRETGTSVDAEE